VIICVDRQADGEAEMKLGGWNETLRLGKVKVIMNGLTRWESRWNPFKEMEDLHSRLVNLYGTTRGRSPIRSGEENEETLRVTEWAPLVDIIEDEKEYLIKAELPEIKREDLSVTVENGVLSITGERKLEKEEKNKKYHRVERAYGSFTRSFTIPDDADGSKVNAQFKDGVLQVHLAKSEKAKPKTVEVKVG
jgi:HSP20 family protein